MCSEDSAGNSVKLTRNYLSRKLFKTNSLKYCFGFLKTVAKQRASRLCCVRDTLQARTFRLDATSRPVKTFSRAQHSIVSITTFYSEYTV